MSFYFIKNYKIKYKLYIIDKRLHYLSSKGDLSYFLLDISAKTDINPFDKKLLIEIQFIPNKRSYIIFKKDFLYCLFEIIGIFLTAYIKKIISMIKNLTWSKKILMKLFIKELGIFYFALKVVLNIKILFFWWLWFERIL